MWNKEDEAMDESRNDEENGTDIMNDNYRGNRNHEKQHLHNISLPCILYSKKDIEAVGDRDQQTTSQRTFHIEISEENDGEISEENDGNNFDREDDIAVFCRPPQEQGLGLMTDEHIACAVGAIKGTDAQKMGFMVKVIKGFEDTLHVMDTRIQGRFDGAENQMDYTMSQLNQGIRQLREVVERVDETCSKRTAENTGESKDDETQTDTLPAVPSFMAFGESELFHRTSTQEFTLSQEENKYPVCSDTFNETTPFEQHTEIETSLPWKIEPTDWLHCVSGGDDKQLAEDLLKQRKLPDQEMLDKACTVFGRTSPIVWSICSSICSYLREKTAENIIDIWPAYEYSKLCADTTKNRITFVVIKENQNDTGLGDVYRTYEREVYICSLESSEVNKLEYSTDLAAENLADLTNCVNENSISLLDAHSNLTMVSASYKISKGFNTTARTIQNKPSVVLYTHVKGLIPLKEEPFPEQIGEYPVDVREAVFRLFRGGRPNEYHENVRMGCAIRNNKIDQFGNFSIGTLGGFLEHPQYGLCCITCSHVLCDQLDNFQTCQNEIRHWTGNDQPKEVFQPCCKGSCPFGHLVCAIYNQGGFGKAGVDIALIKIDSRHPVDGYFPDSDKSDQTGFSTDRPMRYFTGKLCDRKKFKKVLWLSNTAATQRSHAVSSVCRVVQCEPRIQLENTMVVDFFSIIRSKYFLLVKTVLLRKVIQELWYLLKKMKS